ncbi:hypothetical protein JI435_304330 [Parastagonospora nodorum SN15]|uniref:Uncharacterized protein n=1 Tax=Phaeosphaeria nodorum (strain SN15 / ATCC MYA-4574 / FGSC 10173) TaxID=321614 RepID=A0A7U2I9P2_PHANO|nr:hypothetical protein JI435_304330 [Parastagonospora nodorum SN15]
MVFLVLRLQTCGRPPTRCSRHLLASTSREERTLTKLAVITLWSMRSCTPPFTGGRASPWRLLLPPLDPKCTFTVKNVSSFLLELLLLMTSHCATRGLRLAVHASLAGSMRPGLYFKTQACTNARHRHFGRTTPSHICRADAVITLWKHSPASFVGPLSSCTS